MKKSAIVFEVLLIMIAVLAVTLGVYSYVAMSNKGKMTYIEICEKETWVSVDDGEAFYIEKVGEDTVVTSPDGRKYILGKEIGDEYSYYFMDFDFNKEITEVDHTFSAELRQNDDMIEMKITWPNYCFTEGEEYIFKVRDRIGQKYECR